ncbi:MAG: hypothetical protein UU48_C0007G0022 [Candidatus Uhrbacteria bacterium GW2011_GWF2_41_16]|uniref:Methyltransferase domain-containing protein n=2 Tax=Candidatus Uhriibacteriota TaxID=1752732 RepID=A0A0G0VAD5_9BACT|nr:MAG: hypothetical protein UU35_C0005G0015 [Candidatus Uhrbacteria bacterium GW2011_GWC2_41_11]KKR97889.1 MAG: hypothetical protein UU48_C0007G0022 [Candidatus Uhrbacteria bacterium GW2011_GWF2_41_16]
MTTLFLALLIFVQLIFLAVILLVLSFLIFALIGVPWVPTRSKIGRRMYEMVALKPGEIVMDLGCGDGSLLLTAVKEFGAKGIGYEMHPVLCWMARLRARLAGVSSRMEIHCGDFFKKPLPPHVDVIACYLFPQVQAKLEPKFIAMYPPGTRIVSRTFRYPHLPLVHSEHVGSEMIYFYRIPEAK